MQPAPDSNNFLTRRVPACRIEMWIEKIVYCRLEKTVFENTEVSSD